MPGGFGSQRTLRRLTVFMINSLRVLAQRAFVLAGLSLPILLPPQARAQQGGSLDTTFNPGASAISSFTNTSVFSGSVTGIAVQGDGSIVVGGNFSSANGFNRGNIARVNASGVLDAAYGDGPGFNDVVRAVTLQADGLALVGGLFTQYEGQLVPRIARLNADGTLDASFNATGANTGPNSSVRAIAVQGDGNVLIGGFFTTFSNDGLTVFTANRIARLNGADGTFDPSFNAGAGADDSVEAVAVQGDGLVVIGGAFNTYNNSARSRIARLNPDGTLDGTFVTPFFNAPVRALAIQPDGKILVAGDFAVSSNGVTSRGITRLNANGSIDATFAPGVGANNNVQTLALQANGSVVIGGDFTTVNNAAAVHVARLTAAGAVDTTFVTGAGANATVRSLAVQANGNILLGGDFSQVNNVVEIALARLTPNGAVDPAFNPGGQGFGFTATEVDALAVNVNKIYVGGNFSSINGNGRRNIDRLNSDGTPDAGFNPGQGTDGIVRAIVPDAFGGTSADGTTTGAFIGGDFLSVQGVVSPRLARLNPDGSFDPGFGTSVQADGAVRALALSPQGLIVGGDFTQYDGAPFRGIVRVNTFSGAADASFNISGGGADNSVRAIAVQADGRIVVGGDFQSFNGVSRNFFARLLTDGTLDATFNTGTGANGSVEAVAVQPDGRVIIGGAFSTVGGAAHRGVARVNASGTIDPTFNAALDANAIVDTIALQPDGKVVIGGDFINIGGFGRSNVARLNSDGTLDATFNPGSGANGSVRALVIKNNGKTVIGGTFSAVSGAPRARLAQLNGDTPPGAVQFTTDAFSVSESADSVLVTVSRTGGAAGAVSVDYTTADGSATAGSDYFATSGTLTWAAGDLTNKTITVPIRTDAIAEPTETFTLVLSSPDDDVNLGTPNRATVNILDNPPASLQFTQAAYSGFEKSLFGSITVAVSRVGNTVGRVSVDYNLQDITAFAGIDPTTGDYFGTAGTLSWEDGDGTPKTFVVTIFNDDVPEPDETLQAVLSNPLGAAALGNPAVATLTIHDDDAAPIVQFSATNYTVSEGGGFAVITATRSASDIGQVTVDYVTNGGTATANADYTPVVGTLTWQPGDLSPKSFQVPIINDTSMESPETVLITLGNPTGGAVLGARGTATLTITDDDMPSTVQFSAATYNSPAGSAQATITVTRTGGTGTAVTVNYATADGTAVAGTDYAATKGTLNFAVGDAAAKTFIVPILNSSAQTTQKSFTVSLSGATGTTVGTTGTATVTILGDATPVVTVAAKQPAVTEGLSKGKFIITRSGGNLGADLVVRFQLKGAAQPGSDFSAIGKKVTIPAGQTSVKVKFAPRNDGVVEGDEKVKLVLTPTTDYTIGSPAVAIIVVHDANAQ